MIVKEVPIVELFVREGVVSFEIDGDGDVVGRGVGGDFPPEEELVCVGEF